MKRSAFIVLVLALTLLGGCQAWDKALDGEGRTGCVDCEARCWPRGRICWTNPCLCEEWVEECESSKIRICSPCDRPETNQSASTLGDATP